MNSRFAKIIIESQLDEKKEKKAECIFFNTKSGNKFFGLFKSAYITIPIDKD